MATKRTKPKYSSVMLIDDSEIDNFINEKMIEGCGFADRVYVHTSGRSALEFLKNLVKAKSAIGELIPEVIFLDINMPIMDGFQFMLEYGKLPDNIKEYSKVVILTTSINPQDFELARGYKKVEKYVNKPLTEEVLDLL